MKLSILMPAFNEKQWIEVIVSKVLNQDVPGIDKKELVIVDDCSTDGTSEIIEKLTQQFPDQIVIEHHEKNQGKGAAIQTALTRMTGDVCIIQDADLEYDPADYPLVLGPIIDGRADCVYGSRFIGTQPRRVLFFWHYVGNKAVTLLSNILTNLNLTDVETGYKAFRCDVVKDMKIRSRCFGIEPEITAKIARKKCRIFEVGINYNGRTYEEGKKITWVDGFRAIFTIVRFWIIKDVASNKKPS